MRNPIVHALVEALRSDPDGLRELHDLLDESYVGRLVSAREAAARLGVSVEHVRMLARDGDLLAFKIGDAWRFDPHDLPATRLGDVLREKPKVPTPRGTRKVRAGDVIRYPNRAANLQAASDDTGADARTSDPRLRKAVEAGIGEDDEAVVA